MERTRLCWNDLMTDNEAAHYIEYIHLACGIDIVMRKETDVCQSRIENERIKKYNIRINNIYNYSRCSVEQQLAYSSKQRDLN